MKFGENLKNLRKEKKYVNDYLKKIERTDKNIKEFVRYRENVIFRLMDW